MVNPNSNPNTNPSDPISAFFETIFKVACMFGSDEVTGEQAHYEYNDKVLLTGHGEKSIMLLSQFMTLTEEEMLCIRYHMGAYNTNEWEQYGAAIEKYPNVLFSHTADMVASRILKT